MGLFDWTSGIPILGDLLGTTAAEEGKESIQTASQQQQDAATRAMQQSAAQTAPWRTTGENALNTYWEKLQAGPGEFTKSPGYDWRLSQGVNALERGAAAKGRQLSGAQGKALTRYGQDYGSGEYQNWLNQWYQSLTPYQNLSTMGANAATNQATNMYQGNMALGNAQAAGTMGVANTDMNQANQWQIMSPNQWWGQMMGSGGLQNLNQMYSVNPQQQQTQQNNGIAGTGISGNSLVSMWSGGF